MVTHASFPEGKCCYVQMGLLCVHSSHSSQPSSPKCYSNGICENHHILKNVVTTRGFNKELTELGLKA